ncbi:MAG: glycosyltransferase family 2 protein [Coprobacter sp.]|nr:glycosyltransferase family 2 protein [Coprobacter sp.]
MIKDLVTFALPAYKAKYLAAAINSILNQDYENIELIIINDASPENVDFIVSQFSDSRIKYYTNPQNAGAVNLVRNWNKCLSLAQGEYFVMASDDDIYDCKFASTLIDLAHEAPEMDIFHCRVKIIDGNDCLVKMTPACPEFESGMEFIWHRLFQYREQFAPEFMCRTESLRQMQGFVSFPLAWFSDDATWDLLALKKGIGYSSKPLLNWRSSGINITTDRRYMLEKIDATYQYFMWLKRQLSSFSPADEIQECQKADVEKNWKALYSHYIKSILVNSRSQDVWKLLFSRKRKKYDISIYLVIVYWAYRIKKQTGY